MGFLLFALEQNIAFGLEVRGSSKAEASKASRAWLELVQLSDFATYYPHQFEHRYYFQGSLGWHVY